MGAEIVAESLFPFQLDDVSQIHGFRTRNGWYLQQMLKIYAGEAIPSLQPTYLVVDADIVFLKPLVVVDEENRLLFTVGTEYHQPYFKHMKRMHPSLEKQTKYSGIAHHMVMKRAYVDEMKQLVCNYQGSSKPFWKIFLEKVAKEDLDFSGASEYEMFFNFMLKYHPNEVVCRDLAWLDRVPLTNEEYSKYVFYSNHWYQRI